MSVALSLPRQQALSFLGKTLALSAIIAISAHVKVPGREQKITLETTNGGITVR